MILAAAADEARWGDLSDRLLARWISLYEGEPLRVDLRAAIHWVSNGERLTHALHPYPARLLRHVPILFVQSNRYSKPGDLVVDPFCGSGTVLLEASVSGRRAIGADANPLARLLSSVKVTPLAESELRRDLARLLKDIARRRSGSIPEVVNLDYWYGRRSARHLSRIKAGIDAIAAGPVRDFFLVCFSLAARRASLADPRVSVPVRLRRDQYPPDHPLHDTTVRFLDDLPRRAIVTDFADIANENIKRVSSLAARSGLAQAGVTSVDARTLSSLSGARLRTGSARLIVTSPPYVGAQKYIRASSLSIGWLEIAENKSLRELEGSTIGREHFRKAERVPVRTGIPEADVLLPALWKKSPLRAHIATTYLREMRESLVEIARVLAVNGTLVLVSGANRVCGEYFPTPCFLRWSAEELGFGVELELVDGIRSRGLMTRRNRSAAVIDSETVTVIRKRR
jgi:hypothetical protein